MIGAVADNTAAIPELTYCSAQYNGAKTPRVNPIPVRNISLQSRSDKLAFLFQAINKNRTIPASIKRIPAEKREMPRINPYFDS